MQRADNWRRVRTWALCPAAASSTIQGSGRLSLMVLIAAWLTGAAAACGGSSPAGGDDAGAPLADGASGDGAGPADAGPPDAFTCRFADNVPILFNYASVGGDDNLRFLAPNCEYQVVVGYKTDNPNSLTRVPENRALGLRSGYVLGDHGTVIRGMLRHHGIDGTAQLLQQRLDAGYDYLVIDEITSDPEWADTNEISRRFRRVLDALPPYKVIAYVSIDLTQQSGGGALLADRKWVMRAIQRRGGRLALEVYLHTTAVINGAAPDAFRTAAQRLSNAVAGLEGADVINASAFTVLGLSMNTPYPQYNYLDWPANDLRSIRLQVEALSTSGALVRQQVGLGYYFVTKSDITPPSSYPYTFDELLERMKWQARGHLVP